MGGNCTPVLPGTFWGILSLNHSFGKQLNVRILRAKGLENIYYVCGWLWHFFTKQVRQIKLLIDDFLQCFEFTGVFFFDQTSPKQIKALFLKLQMLYSCDIILRNRLTFLQSNRFIKFSHKKCKSSYQTEWRSLVNRAPNLWSLGGRLKPRQDHIWQTVTSLTKELYSQSFKSS